MANLGLIQAKIFIPNKDVEEFVASYGGDKNSEMKYTHILLKEFTSSKYKSKLGALGITSLVLRIIVVLWIYVPM